MADITIHSPMTGRVIEVLVSEGESVSSGDVVVVVESMKMENEIICDYGRLRLRCPRRRRPIRLRRRPTGHRNDLTAQMRYNSFHG